ncbi:MAG: carbohydrate ABC transporter permease, partial [Vicinamibacteraceae bacterium]
MAAIAVSFCLPAVVLYGVIVIYPMLTAFSYSFFTWEGLSRADFAGLDNYTTLFTTYPFNEQLPRAFLHNVEFFIGTFIIQNSIGLGLALLLHTSPHGKRFFQILLSSPYLISPLIVGYLWTLLLSPIYGPINTVFEAVGLDSLSRGW